MEKLCSHLAGAIESTVWGPQWTYLVSLQTQTSFPFVIPAINTSYPVPVRAGAGRTPCSDG